MNNRIVEDFIKLAKKDSLSFGERQVADQIKELLAEMGIEAFEDNAGGILGGNCGNVYAIWEGDVDKPSVLLSAHMDTVSPGIGKKPTVSTEERYIHSDGTTVLGADDLAGVVEILEGIRRVIASRKKHRTVELLFPVAEEVYTKGAAVFDYSKICSKEAYCFDLSGNVGLAARKAPSLISFKVKVLGKASHAGFAPEEGINSILITSKAIARISQGQVDAESTVNIGKISGGIATNIVPASCICEGEIRSFDHELALKYLKEIQQIFEETANEYQAEIEFNSVIHFKAYEIELEEKVVKNFEHACEQIGIKATLISTLGGSDNNQFNAHGIRGIVVSCGMENVHTVDEYIKIENLYRGAELVEQLILE